MKTPSCISLVFIACFLCVCEKTWGADILYISASTSPSHNIWDKTLSMALIDKGHHITYVTHSPEKNSDNFSVIILEGVTEQMLVEFDLENMMNMTAADNVKMLYDWVHYVCSLNLKTEGHAKIIKLAESGKKFDTIIIDLLPGICFYPLVELFDNPILIATSPFGISPYMAPNFGIDLQSSYIPHCTVRYSNIMSFKERIYNYFIHMYEIGLKYYYWGLMKNMLDEHHGRDTKAIFEVERNFSILLTNYDPVLDYPRPLPPDVIPVGGLHTKRANKLPEDLKKYLDNSKNGVIVFSLGTNVRSDKLKESKKKIILEVFAQLKQNIIWKFESDISGLPKNVIVRKFLPQNDILAHPNLKLLINHGGALSSQEAMYHGVPLITIPFFMDQHAISHKVVNRKIGSTLNYENLTTDYMLSTIQEVVNNPIYSENAKKLSRTFRDRPEAPLDRAVFWIEHVLRQGGAKGLNLPARQMFLFQIELVDIFLLFTGLLITGIVVIKIIFWKIFKGQSKEATKLKTK